MKTKKKTKKSHKKGKKKAKPDSLIGLTYENIIKEYTALEQEIIEQAKKENHPSWVDGLMKIFGLRRK